MSEFPSLTGATAHIIVLTGPAENPSCLLQLQDERMAFYKFFGGYIDIAKQERIEEAIRREIDEEALGLASLLDLNDKRLHTSMWFSIMNYRKERKETCTYIIIWMNDTERAYVEEYARNQNEAILLKASGGETSGVVLKQLLDILEETFSTDGKRRKLLFPHGFLEHLAAILPLEPARVAAIQQMMAKREAEKEK